jgi:GTP-binding protein
MLVKSAAFITSATRQSQYPETGLPEVAFVGRSNVGKSSLINTLVNRKRLVKTSNTPGRTQLINFFDVNDAIVMVDLPGYGYARVPKAVQDRWRPMIETYLTRRAQLRAVVLLLDLRRKLDQRDLDLYAWLRYHDLTVITVLTKCDKLSKSRQSLQRRDTAEVLGVPERALIMFSARTRKGRDAVWAAIDQAVNDDAS